MYSDEYSVGNIGKKNKKQRIKEIILGIRSPNM